MAAPPAAPRCGSLSRSSRPSGVEVGSTRTDAAAALRSRSVTLTSRNEPARPEPGPGWSSAKLGLAGELTPLKSCPRTGQLDRRGVALRYSRVRDHCLFVGCRAAVSPSSAAGGRLTS